jgi:hypothetical protein
MNGYICFFNQKRIEVYAETKYAAQTKAAAIFKTSKKPWRVNVNLAEVDGRPITLSTTSL